MAICETVKVQDGKGGFIVINKSDYSKAEHKLFGTKKPAPKQTPKPAAKPTPKAK